MDQTDLMAAAAAPLPKLVRAVDSDHLRASTPCSEWDVRALVNHQLFWGPSLVGAARKDSVPPPAPGESDVDLTAGDWQQAFEQHIDALVTAWSEPEAWEGMTVMALSPRMPAPMIGGMVVGELVVHGWDLARATGQEPDWEPEVLDRLHQELTMTADQGRQLGVYAPEVPVPANAPMLARVLGLTGRDPSWTPA